MTVANLDPIYSSRGQVEWAVALLAANTAKDGTGTVSTIFTGNATAGGFVQHIRCKAAGTNVATVVRIFMNNGATNATAANNVMIGELTLAATTLSEVAATQEYSYPLNIAIPPGFKINVAIGTAVAAGWIFSAVGGSYQQ